MLLAGLRSHVSQEAAVLSAGSALALMGIDVWYTARRIIPRVYLLDAAAELVLLAGFPDAKTLIRPSATFYQREKA